MKTQSKKKSTQVVSSIQTARALRKQSTTSCHEEETTIIEKLKRGENLAFRQLMQQEQKKTYRLIRQMVIDHDDANDLTQETFIKVSENIRKFQGKSKLSTWIHRIAVNTANDFLRSKHRKYRNLSVSIDNKIENKIKGYSADSEKHKQDNNMSFELDMPRIHTLFGKLSDKDQLVIQRSFLEDMADKDVAEELYVQNLLVKPTSLENFQNNIKRRAKENAQAVLKSSGYTR
jgi:RNA polymerase sigma-70 factor (ECF subfamily)